MPAPTQAPRTIKASSFLKYKALKLVLPELANSYDIPAEAPVFISPYIVHKSHCYVCEADYSPLLYQIGRTTHAQHTCKTNGGGIYVRLASDHSGKWVYTNDLWDCIVHPHGPIRMGNDRGYQFESVTPHTFVTPQCHLCKQPLLKGTLITNSSTSLVAACGTEKCKGYTLQSLYVGTLYPVGWDFSFDGASITFHPTHSATHSSMVANDPQPFVPLSYEAFMEQTNKQLRRTPQ